MADSRIYTYGLLPPTRGWDACYEERFRCEGQPAPGIVRYFEQLELGHAYRNALAALDQKFREMARAESAAYTTAGLAEHKSRLDAIQERITQVREEIRAKRQKAGKPKRRGEKGSRAPVDVSAERAILATLETERKAVRQALREARAAEEGISGDLKARIRAARLELRAAVREAGKKRTTFRLEAARAAVIALRQERQSARSVVPRLRALDQMAAQREEEIKKARADSHLYVGTYQILEQSAKAARGRPDDRVCRPFCGEGRIGIYLTQPTPVRDLLRGGCTHVQIDDVPAEAWDPKTRCTWAKHLRRTKMRIRVGSHPDRSPLWVEFPGVYHRQLPEDGVVRWAWVHRRRRGPRFEYQLHVVVTADSFQTEAARIRDRLAAEGARGTIAVDVGWRQTPQGLRIAYWADDRGEHGEVLLDPVVIQRLDHADELAARRQRNFNFARQWLTDWLRDRPVPEWLAAQTRTITAWRSPRALDSLVRRWCGGRFEDLVRAANPHRPERWGDLAALLTTPTGVTFPGDGAIVGGLLTWASEDRHLWWWEREGPRALARRRESYRNLGAAWAKKYERVVFEDFDLRNTAKAEPPEEASYESGRIRREAQRTAAPSELRASVEWAFETRGGRRKRVPSPGTTALHAACGRPLEGDAAAQIDLYCSVCRVTVDQDHNAALNLLALADQAPPDGERPPVENENGGKAAGEGA